MASKNDPPSDPWARVRQAVDAEDFELAARLRDEILAAGQVSPPSDAPPSTRIRRQVPGAMGLGTDQQAFKPPLGWTPPPRPQFNTANHKRARRWRS